MMGFLKAFAWFVAISLLVLLILPSFVHACTMSSPGDISPSDLIANVTAELPGGG